jgi:predicted nucleic acid-binding protein
LNYLFDTNVISELRKGKRCDPNVARWFAGVNEEEIFFSVLTIGEIRMGIDRIQRRDVKRAAALNRWLRGLIDGFQDKILPVDREIAEEWGRLNAPDPLPVIDSLLAATAKRHGLSVATRNTRDIGRTGVDCVNPFESHSA